MFTRSLAADVSTSGLFMEYVNAIKGSRQLVWSRGLKAAVGVDDKTDEEIAQEEATRVTDRISLTLTIGARSSRLMPGMT